MDALPYPYTVGSLTAQASAAQATGWSALRSAKPPLAYAGLPPEEELFRAHSALGWLDHTQTVLACANDPGFERAMALQAVAAHYSHQAVTAGKKNWAEAAAAYERASQATALAAEEVDRSGGVHWPASIWRAQDLSARAVVLHIHAQQCALGVAAASGADGVAGMLGIAAAYVTQVPAASSIRPYAELQAAVWRLQAALAFDPQGGTLKEHRLLLRALLRDVLEAGKPFTAAAAVTTLAQLEKRVAARAEKLAQVSVDTLWETAPQQQQQRFADVVAKTPEGIHLPDPLHAQLSAEAEAARVKWGLPSASASVQQQEQQPQPLFETRLGKMLASDALARLLPPWIEAVVARAVAVERCRRWTHGNDRRPRISVEQLLQTSEQAARLAATKL